MSERIRRMLAERVTDFDPGTVDPAGEAYGSVEEAWAAHIDGVEP